MASTKHESASGLCNYINDKRGSIPPFNFLFVLYFVSFFFRSSSTSFTVPN